MSSKFLVALLFATLTSFAAHADRSLDSRGPYLVIQSGRTTIHKINSSGQTQIFYYDSQSGKSAFQRIDNEIARDSVEKGSFHTANNAAIVDWASMKDGYTYGTIFGPPGEELFVIETSKFKNRGNQIDYEAFKSLCDHVSFVPSGR